MSYADAWLVLALAFLRKAARDPEALFDTKRFARWGLCGGVEMMMESGMITPRQSEHMENEIKGLLGKGQCWLAPIRGVRGATERGTLALLFAAEAAA